MAPKNTGLTIQYNHIGDFEEIMNHGPCEGVDLPDIPSFGDFSDIEDNQVGRYGQNFSIADLINISPNPVSSFINVSIKNSKYFSLACFNSNGKSVIEYTYKNQGFVSQISKRFDFSNFPSGLYYLNINTEKGKQTFKIVKEK